MSSRAHLVSQAVEQALLQRVSAPFAMACRSTERVPFGIAALDAVSQGGVPVGALTELVGAEGSGRTTAALGLLARAHGREGVSAWVDASDALDPAAAAANGVDLRRLLWVRCGGGTAAVEVAPVPGAGVAAKAAEVGQTPVPVRGGGSPHPRSEGRDMPQAIRQMLGETGALDRPRSCGGRGVGTPGAANRPVAGMSVDREEQVPTDRLPPRRGVAPVGAQVRREQVWRGNVTPKAGQGTQESGRPWQAIDQALRVTDLLLTNGGFGVIVLDLGGLPGECTWRIPLATWFRYRAACERGQTSLVLLTQHPCARSSAGLVLRFAPGQMEVEGGVMTGLRFEAAVERSRFAVAEAEGRVVPIRKGPGSVRGAGWTGRAAWV